MFKKIVLATDGSDISREAGRKAAELAVDMDAELVAVFVSTPFPYLTASEKDQFVQSARTAAESAFGELADLIQEKAAFEAVFAESKDVGSAVMQVIEDKQADLLVVGSHGYSGLNKLLLGSVANKLAGRAPCPVLIVR